MTTELNANIERGVSEKETEITNEKKLCLKIKGELESIKNDIQNKENTINKMKSAEIAFQEKETQYNETISKCKEQLE